MATPKGKTDELGNDRVKQPDAPSARPEQTTGAGAEALVHTDGAAEGHGREHRSGYGGKGGVPDTPSDDRK